MLGALEQLKAHALQRLLDCQATARPTTPPAETYLSVKDVCARFHVTERWLYRHKQQMPHSQPSRKTLLFPEKAIGKWFAAQRQAH